MKDKDELPPDEPTTLYEWLWRLKRYQDGIFVRERIEGHFRNVALSQLPPDRWAYWVARWLDENALPMRIKGGRR